MKLLKDWNNLTLNERNLIIFDGRNQKYGAYELRQNYNIRITYIIASIIAFSLILLLVKKVVDRPSSADDNEKMEVVQIDLTPPPPIDETPPPPPPPPPPPMVELVKFTPPVIKDDAVEETPQKLQEEVKDVNVSTIDQEGDKDLIAPLVEGPGETAPEIFLVVEENAEFPGGFTAMMKYMQQNVQYPPMAREAGISGKCFLKFVVNETGEISNVEVLKGVPGCSDCDKEAIRVVKSMPKWKAAKMTGRAVKCYFNLPFSFKIQ